MPFSIYDIETRIYFKNFKEKFLNGGDKWFVWSSCVFEGEYTFFVACFERFEFLAGAKILLGKVLEEGLWTDELFDVFCVVLLWGTLVHLRDPHLRFDFEIIRKNGDSGAFCQLSVLFSSQIRCGLVCICSIDNPSYNRLHLHTLIYAGWKLVYNNNIYACYLRNCNDICKVYRCWCEVFR